MMCEIHWVKISFAKIYRVEFEREVNANLFVLENVWLARKSFALFVFDFLLLCPQCEIFQSMVLFF
jgi:hypothetical protein